MGGQLWNILLLFFFYSLAAVNDTKCYGSELFGPHSTKLHNLTKLVDFSALFLDLQ